MNSTKGTGTLPYKETQDLTEEKRLDFRRDVTTYELARQKGEFTGHENEWVTVHNQKVVEYGKEYSDDQLDYVLETMPGAIQHPVDQTHLPLRSKPAKMVISQRANSGDDYKIIRRPNENNLIAIFSYDFYDTMNNNKKYTCVVDTGAPESILPFHVKRILGRRGWSTNLRIELGLWSTCGTSLCV
ncbi:hypothetical protein C2G38_2145636 [Gigaspora rosea]|uniref:Peptidase A2 domain-containing protein n=2 Tax=Gigasporaceae TaxID=36753 RepID=A0A397UQ56_9GLOM|nr:hypothetical protein C2G38_2145636 [Gigaspora rosea]